MNPFVTVSGRFIPFGEVTTDDIRIDDIAWHLAALCRFGGAAAPNGYSFAEHSIRLAHRFDRDPPLARQALLFWAPRAYVGDPPPAIEAHDDQFRAIEGNLWRAIVERFALGLEVDSADPRLFQIAAEVRREDLRLEATAIRDLQPKRPRGLSEGVPYDDVAIRAPWSFNSARFEYLALAERWDLT